MGHIGSSSRCPYFLLCTECHLAFLPVVLEGHEPERRICYSCRVSRLFRRSEILVAKFEADNERLRQLIADRKKIPMNLETGNTTKKK